MATAADSVVTVARGAFPALGMNVGLVEVTLDLATVSAELAAQGDGVLATGDVIQAISLVKGTVVLAAGIQITETVVGVAALPVALGITGVDANGFVVEADIGSGTSYVAGDHMPAQTDVQGAIVIGTGAGGAATDTIDVLCGTVTATTVTAGKLRVWALIVDALTLEG